MMRVLAAGLVLVAALAGCGTVPQSSAGSSAALRPGAGEVETIQNQGVAAPHASASIRGAPPGISVYDASTYNQPAYTYPSSARGLTGETPRDPPPGGVSARIDVSQVIVRMDDGSRQAITGRLPDLRVGDRVLVGSDGKLSRP